MAAADLWPWLAVAGIGALHGLNPATGWMLAAAWGVRSRDQAQALRALMPIAVGHAASIGLVAGAVTFGLAMDRVSMQVLAGGLFVAAAVLHLWGRTPKAARAPAGHAGLALWSFMMSTAHGAGLMLVPALIPLCMTDGAGTWIDASGSLMLAFAAVGVHTAAMLAVTGLIAIGACRGFDAAACWLRSACYLRTRPRLNRKNMPIASAASIPPSMNCPTMAANAAPEINPTLIAPSTSWRNASSLPGR
ncbi:hypothetical protein J2W23_002332 [Variovorax boronicumulans]|nr:hypothetical protein [Variovorax boronicumulans]